MLIRQVTGNLLARIAALCTSVYTDEISSKGEEGGGVIFRLDECVPCCVRSAQFVGRDLMQIIC